MEGKQKNDLNKIVARRKEGRNKIKARQKEDKGSTVAG